MNAPCTGFVIIVILLTLTNCDDNVTENGTTTAFFEDENITTTTFLEDNNITTTIPITTEKAYTHWGYRGLYGGSYYNKEIKNPNNIHWIHGTYQPAIESYYIMNDYGKNAEGDTLDYYIGYGLSKVIDPNFKYDNYHNFAHNINRTIKSNDTINSDQILACHPNSIFFCPENTESVCLFNGTIYCLSKISSVVPCQENISEECVITAVPCVRSCRTAEHNIEMLTLRCLARVTIRDVYADGRGTTIARVGTTFVLVPALSLEDRTYCVTIIVDPVLPG